VRAERLGAQQRRPADELADEECRTGGAGDGGGDLAGESLPAPIRVSDRSRVGGTSVNSRYARAADGACPQGEGGLVAPLSSLALVEEGDFDAMGLGGSEAPVDRERLS
jgi:hypothetical protein